jgi:peptidylprolyl isomerase
MRRASLLLAALAALAAAGCGSSNTKKTTTSTATQPAQSAPADTSSTPAPSSSSSGGAATIKASPTKNLNRKPAIPRQAGDPPGTLVKQDIVKGTGATAKAGDQITVRYVGVRFRDGQQFDASWDRRPNSFPFPLGASQVIQGWDKGIVGMKVGGRRQLTIPPDLAYGAQGFPPDILPNETLIFVVDLTKVQKSG